MFQTNCVEKIKTYILCSQYFPENRAYYEIMWKKYPRAGHATHGNTAIQYMTLSQCWMLPNVCGLRMYSHFHNHFGF